MNLKHTRKILAALFIFSTAACSTGPSRSEYVYHDEELSSLHQEGVVEGFVMLPLDDFPLDHRKTDVYFNRIGSGPTEDFVYRGVSGSFAMKLPAGQYQIEGMWHEESCFESNFKSAAIAAPASPLLKYLTFEVQAGKKVNIGQLLLTCMEWSGRDRYEKERQDFLTGPKIDQFRITEKATVVCGCKLLRKFPIYMEHVDETPHDENLKY